MDVETEKALPSLSYLKVKVWPACLVVSKASLGVRPAERILDADLQSPRARPLFILHHIFYFAPVTRVIRPGVD